LTINSLPPGSIRTLAALAALLALVLGGRWAYQAYNRRPPPLAVVDSSAQRPVVTPKRAQSTPVEINRGDSAAFERLPHIGPATARRIVRYRAAIGGFRSLAQFRKVWGMDTLYPKIAAYVYLDSSVLPAVTGARVPRSGTQPQAAADFVRAAPPAPTARPTPQPIDLNQADSAALEALPMIGPTLARRIVQYRAKLGFYSSVEQLHEVYGLQDTHYVVAAPFLFIGPVETLPHLYINEAAEAQLAKHPYVGFTLARRIVRYRDQHGPYRSLQDLGNLYGIKAETWQRLSPYLNFR
jgi:DNA uptake protein ComE-like DNA-binding protein